MNFENMPNARIERIVSGGDGMAVYNDRKIFIPFSAPGDKLFFEITEDHGNWARGKILEIEEPSPCRVKPVCKNYGSCGACTLMHINYETQLKIKEEIINDCFSRIGRIKNLQDIKNPALNGRTLHCSGVLNPSARMDFCIKPSPEFNVRNRVQLHCLPEERSVLGFMSSGKNEVIKITECPVADEGIQKALANGSIKPPPEKDRFNVFSHNDVFLSEGGKTRGKISILGKELVVDAGLFFQSNVTMLEVLLKDLEKKTEGADQKLPFADLYCGVGTFAAMLKKDSPSGLADLVEKNKDSLNLAKENMSEHKNNCRFFALTGDEWSKKQKGKFGLIIADPPREGLTPLLKNWLIKNKPGIFAYISCNPAALARDANELTALQKNGNSPFTLMELTVYDFYPQTAHIESLALFYSNA